MPVLARFDTPARLAEPTEVDRTAWHARVKGSVAEHARQFSQFFDPTETDVDHDVMAPVIAWNAFPATLLKRRPRSSNAGGTPTPPGRCRTSTASGASSAIPTA